MERRARGGGSLLVALLLAAWGWLWLGAPGPSARPLAEVTPAVAGEPIAAAEAAPATIEALQQRIAAVLEREGVPGVGVALVDREGVRWAGGVGMADAAAGTPVTAGTVFRVASVTKGIVGLGAARLWAQGRLSLDDPLALLLPRLRIDNPWEAEAPVTLAHALEHTAGFDDMRFNETFTDHERTTPAQALALNPRSRAVRWRPGSRMSYSNVGYSVAALAMERVTGQPFDAWLRAQVLMPLGMGSASFSLTEERRARLATGYVQPGRAAAYAPIAHRAAGSLLATPAEMGRWVHYWLTRGEPYPEVAPLWALERVEGSGTHRGPGTDLAYGLGNYGDVAHPVRARGHDGGLPGFSSSVRYFPELGVGYVMLLNSTHSRAAYAEIRGLLFAYLAQGRSLPEPPRTPPEPSRAEATGYYAYASPRLALFGFIERVVVGWSVHPSPAGIWVTPRLGSSVELVPTGEGGYRHPLESGTSLRVGRDASGERVLTLGWAHAEPQSWWWATLRLWVLTGAVFLLQLAPLLGALWLAQRLVRGAGLQRAGLWLWPALAGLALMAMPWLLSEASARNALGRVDPATVGLCAATVVFAMASALGLAAAVRATVGRDRTAWPWRVWPALTSTAAMGLTAWLGAHGIIGLRTWVW